MGTRRRRLSRMLAVALLSSRRPRCSQVADPVDPRGARRWGCHRHGLDLGPPGSGGRGRGAAGVPSTRSTTRRTRSEADLTFIPEARLPPDAPDDEARGPARRARVRRAADGVADLLAQAGAARRPGRARRRSTTRRSRCRRRTPTSATTSCTRCRCSTPASGSTATGACWRRPACASRPVSTMPGRRRSSTRCWRSSPTTDPDGKPLDSRRTTARPYSSYAFLPIVNSTGTEVVVDNRAEGNLNSAPVVDAARQFASWRRYVDPEHRRRGVRARPRTALSWVGHWVYGLVRRGARRRSRSCFRCPTSGSARRAVRDRWRGASAPQTDKGPAAAKFLEYLMADESVALMTDGNGAPPGTETVTAASDLYGARRAAGAVRRGAGPNMRHRSTHRGVRGDPATGIAGLADDRRRSSPRRGSPPTTAPTRSPSSTGRPGSSTSTTRTTMTTTCDATDRRSVGRSEMTLTVDLAEGHPR